MRRKEREITDQELIVQLLKKAKVCRLAIHDEPFPYIVPLNYGFKDGALYFHCAITGKKLDLLKKNNKVGFEIEGANEIVEDEVSCRWTTRYRSIIGKGEVEMIEDAEAKREGFDVIMNHFGKFDNEYHPRAIEKALVLKMKIVEMTGKQAGDWV